MLLKLTKRMADSLLVYTGNHSTSCRPSKSHAIISLQTVRDETMYLLPKRVTYY